MTASLTGDCESSEMTTSFSSACENNKVTTSVSGECESNKMTTSLVGECESSKMVTSLTGECESSDQVVKCPNFNLRDDSDLAMLLYPRPKKTLNISEKIEMIKLIDSAPHMKKKDIAALYGIPLNTVSTIYSNREKLLNHSEFSNSNKMRIRASSFPEVEAELLKWYVETYRNNPGQRPPCHLLRLQALQIAHSLGIANFSASNGWLERFKVRHNLKVHQYKTKKKSLAAALSGNAPACDQSRTDASLNGNSSEQESSNSHNLQSDLKPNVQMMAVEQEYSLMKTLYQKATLYQNASSHIVPDHHVQSSDIKCDDVERHEVTPCISYLQGRASPSDVSIKQTRCEESLHHDVTPYVSYSSDKAGTCDVTIKELEEAYCVIHRYLSKRRKCDVPEKTLEAVKEIKYFIASEKDKVTQLKITDFFSSK